jgi:hypothetical protein
MRLKMMMLARMTHSLLDESAISGRFDKSIAIEVRAGLLSLD